MKDYTEENRAKMAPHIAYLRGWAQRAIAQSGRNRITSEARDDFLSDNPDLAIELLRRGLTVESIQNVGRMESLLREVVAYSRAWRKNGDRDDLWDVIAEIEQWLGSEL